MNDRDNDGADAIPDFEREGLTAILPAYNEEANIFRAVELVRSALETVTSNYEIIVVDDGSVDKTRAIAGSLEKEDPRVRVIHHERNRGYGAALRSGFAAASKGFCFHTDSDCQFDLSEMREMALAAVDADVVAGYRIHRRDLPHRRLSAAAYNQLLRRVFGLRLRDADCAYKIYRTALVKDIKLSSDSILISAEMLIKISNAGGRIKEFGVNHHPREKGKQAGNSLRTLAHAPKEPIRLWPELDGRGSGRRASRP